MDERKLNFSAPLLSARRPSMSRVPSEGRKTSKAVERYSYISDAHPEQVTKPVAVPFTWEQIPGLPKISVTSRSKSCELHSGACRMESKKMFDVLKQRVEKKSAVRSTQKIFTVVDSYKTIVPKSEYPYPKEKLAIRKVHPSFNEEKMSETLSAMEAVSVTCSGSAVSHGENSLSIASRDTQIQDFMMRRFLPAAQAVALQPPLSAVRKVPAVVEQKRQVTKLVRVERNYPDSFQFKEDGEDEFDDEDSCVSAHITTKACGLLPRLCFKNSLPFFVTGKGGTPLPSPPRRFQSPLKKIPLPRMVASKPKQESAPQTPRTAETPNKIRSGFNERPSMSRTSSPLRRSGVLSPHRSRSPQRQNPCESESLKPNKIPYYRGGIRSQDLSSYQATKQWSCPLIPAMEKTAPENQHQVADVEIGQLRSTETATERGKRYSFEGGRTVSVNRNSATPLKTRKHVEEEYAIDSMYGFVDLPAAPALPKSPSESWLWRTLPSLPARNSDSKAHPEVVKWENIVRSSCMHGDRVRYSEELVPQLCKQAGL